MGDCPPLSKAPRMFRGALACPASLGWVNTPFFSLCACPAPEWGSLSTGSPVWLTIPQIWG